MNHFLSKKDIKHTNEMIELAKALKADPFAHQHLGKNKTLILLFFNPSLRTRLSTQKAAQNLGMNVMVMNVGSDGWKLELEDGTVMDSSTQEHIKEAISVISEYADVLGVRTFPTLTDREADYGEAVMSKIVANSSVPVISLESAIGHPLQGFADVLTISEHQPNPQPKVVLTWAPHPKPLPQAVPNSFVEWVKGTGAELVIAHPKGYALSEQFTEGVPILHDQKAAFAGADFIYAKSWSAFEPYGKHLETPESWTVTEDKMALTNAAKFMHCLPVRRNVVVSDAVIDSPQSLVVQQAGNRVWSAQAVLHTILSK